MLTKTQFALAILREFCNEEGYNNITEIQEIDIFKNVNLAVAMEFLDKLTSQVYKRYVSDCDGIIFGVPESGTNKYNGITTRDMLKILPDGIQGEQEC